MNFYNDSAPEAAAWLDMLQLAGEIPNGVVEDVSISDLDSRRLDQFTQCHFFAGIGGWSLALRIAGWPESRPVWTGSCPCQPFSQAGPQLGEADERHLWPAFLRHIDFCRPSVLFGEQVASALGRDWLAGVRLDLEALGYAVGAADLCAAGVGAPHMRQRLFFGAVRLGNPFGEGLERPKGVRNDPFQRRAATERASPWAGAEWLDCRDGKHRRIEPSIPLLVDGVPSSVAGPISGFGNAIVPHLAAEFIQAFMEAVG